MVNKAGGPAETKSFRPDGIRRVIETAADEGHGHPTLTDIARMAIDEADRLSAFPPGPARDAELHETWKTLDDVLAERRRRRTFKEWLRSKLHR